MIPANSPCATESYLSIYPNPAKGSLTATVRHLPEGFAVIHLIGINGNVIKTFRITEQVNVLDLQDIAPGSYLLKVQNGASSENIKIVVL